MGMTRDIRSAVYEELRLDPLIDPIDIAVEVAGGDVSLIGRVPSQAQRTEAAMAAERVPGVTNVRNHLDVARSSSGSGSDIELAALANEALTASITVPAGIKATASEGSIRLTGWVTYDAQRLAAQDAVAGVAGVKSIRNDIEVQGYV
jgi:osmotically-inducible protein OsmY